MERYADARRVCSSYPGSDAVINVGDPMGARFAAELSSGVELTSPSGAAPPRRVLNVGASRLRTATRAQIRGHFGDRRLRSP
jgi:hypothetical protein